MEAWERAGAALAALGSERAPVADAAGATGADPPDLEAARGGPAGPSGEAASSRAAPHAPSDWQHAPWAQASQAAPGQWEGRAAETRGPAGSRPVGGWRDLTAERGRSVRAPSGLLASLDLSVRDEDSDASDMGDDVPDTPAWLASGAGMFARRAVTGRVERRHSMGGGTTPPAVVRSLGRRVRAAQAAPAQPRSQEGSSGLGGPAAGAPRAAAVTPPPWMGRDGIVVGLSGAAVDVRSDDESDGE